MSIVLVGLNHRTAPVAMRERLSLAGTALRTALEDLCGRDGSCYSGSSQAPCAIAGPATLHEGVILSTCNRLEVYAVAEETGAAWEAIAHFLARRHGLALDLLSAHLYCKEGRAAIEHLMRVAAGLDSMILGDPQILGQVAHAFGEAQAARTSGAILSHLFAQALHAGKRARTETGVSRQTTSVGHAAALVVKAKVEDLSCTQVLVVGAGKMAALAARAMQMQGARDITCINRTCARAEAVAGQVQGRALTWACLSDGLAAADVVITATGAPHTVIGVDDVGPVLARRSGRSLLFVDIAVPRDVDTAVGDLPHVPRFAADDLPAVLAANWGPPPAPWPRVQ